MANCGSKKRMAKNLGGVADRVKKSRAAREMPATNASLKKPAPSGPQKGINPPGQRPAPKKRPKPPASGGMKGINPPGAKPAPKATKRPATSQAARSEMAKRMATRAAAMRKRFGGRGR